MIFLKFQIRILISKEDLFIGEDDAIESSESESDSDDPPPKPNSCLVDKAAVELVSKLNIIKEGQMSSDIFPADVAEFTDYLKRNRITGFRQGLKIKALVYGKPLR